MNRSYLRLALAVVVVGLALGIVSRLPRREAVKPRVEPAAERVELVLEIGPGGAVDSDRDGAPKGAIVELRIVNRGSVARTLSLSGYEEKLRLPVAPGEIAHATFRADRPGGDFAWLVDGVPTGHFAVSGSHLEEGRQ
ncbi:MAG: hypothetical protein AABZ94_03335 [Candidatus Eisenbacteria bacterium]